MDPSSLILVGYVTDYLSSINNDKIPKEYKYLPYSTKSFYDRLLNNYPDKMCFAGVWSLETLRRIVLSKREKLEKECFELDENIKHTDDEFLTLYFNHFPRREDYLQRIEEMIKEEADIKYEWQERPIWALMNGFFFFEGYQRNLGFIENNKLLLEQKFPVEGNTKYLSDEDWQKIALAHGLKKDISHQTITKVIATEQTINSLILIKKNFLMINGKVSRVAMLIQDFP